MIDTPSPAGEGAEMLFHITRLSSVFHLTPFNTIQHIIDAMGGYKQ
jgi:hypothetical protein